MENCKDKIILYPNTFKYIGLFLICLVFSLSSILLCYLGIMDTAITDTGSRVLVIITGGAGVLLFLPMSCYIIQRLINKKPSLIIDDTGIYDNASYTSAGFLPWSEIDSVTMWKQEYKVGSQKILGIKVKNEDQFINKFYGVKRILIRTGRYPVNIPQNGINARTEDVHNIMNHYFIIKGSNKNIIQ